MIGHNPLGAISVLALILIMGFQVITGLFAVDVDGIESGPWSVHVSFDTGRWLAGLHHLNFTIIQVLVAFHVAAILFHLFYKRENLVLPMITGKKHARVDSASMTAVSPVRLAICVAVAAGLTYLLINF